MNKRFLLVAVLFTIICSSCSNRLLYPSGKIGVNNTDLSYNDRLVMRVDTSLLNIQKSLKTVDEQALSKSETKYFAKLLKEADAVSDTLLAVSNYILIVKNSDEPIKPAICRQYFYDKDLKKFSNYYIDSEDAPQRNKNKQPISFFRETFVCPKSKRTIVKDTFTDVSIIYVLQGKHPKVNWSISLVWDPSTIKDFIGIAYEIKRSIDPISESIALRTP